MTLQSLVLRLHLLEDWHAGSGAGRGAGVDAVPSRSAAGLPRLPGRTLRGLLREAVALAAEIALPGVEERAADLLFGSPPLQANRPESQDGCLRVSDAVLPAALEAWVAADTKRGRQHAATLFRTLSSTAIEAGTGQARTGSLRVVEVAKPLLLEAVVHALPSAPETWAQPLRAALPLIRGLGSQRRRGLGRLSITAVAPTAGDELAHG